MQELILAMVFMAVLSMALFFLTRRLVSGSPPLALDALAVLLVLSIGVYVRVVWGQLWIVRWIPFASVIVLANWFPLILGMLAGVLWERTRRQTVLRRLPAQMILIAGAVWSEVYVIPQNPPQCGDDWIEPSQLFPVRICLQTTPETCSAAAAATILTMLGVPATEAEMAQLCLTREGTTWLGLYHGLSVRLRGTPYHVEFFECPVDQLAEIVDQYPALLCCQLTDEVDMKFPDYSVERGWIPGIRHSTVLIKPLRNTFVIGDPSQRDPELWTREDLTNLWTGTGLRVVANPER